MDPEIVAFVSHSSADSHLILDCFTPNFKLMYSDSDNIKADRVNLHQIKCRATFFGTPGILSLNSKSLTHKIFQ